MKVRSVIAPSLALVAIAMLATMPYPASSESTTGAVSAGERVDRQANLKARVQARLGRMAERLAITPSQQTVWDAYAKTVEDMIPAERAKPPAEADAAALLRFRSERAAVHAQKLAQLAEATAALQQVLSPEQQQTLNEMMRRAGKHGGHRGYRRG